ncbi:PLP-dependent transferase [Gigaspora margarita]|uniref:PLP-dependent transferase n=1 Tax=Gigaspora margarita TaxID=4874 RepID=A0A8H3X5D1_GIGMA|nr:PLP-dependent transferase [Gigaspora margarita]
MYHPTKNFQIYQIFAANTNLGKTIFSTGLCRSSASKFKNLKKINNNNNNNNTNINTNINTKINTNINTKINNNNLNPNLNINTNVNHKTYYLKPIQTGYSESSDENFISCFLNSEMIVKTTTLFKYEKPLSPHLAVDKSLIPKDDDVLLATKNHITECAIDASLGGGTLFLETAGGVASPTMSGTLQSEFYRPLRLPTILIGDSNLGGISTTISSFESLRLRGYDIPIILLFDNSQYKNHTFLQNYFQKNFLNQNNNNGINNISIKTIPSPPPPPPSLNHSLNKNVDILQLKKYFGELDGEFNNILEILENWHNEKFNRLNEMAECSKDVVWWPFTQYEKIDKVNVIDSAYNDFMVIYDNDQKNQGGKKSKNDGIMKEMFDASSSWWTQGLGHGSSKLSLSASYAAGRYGHVLFPECIHEPALSLSQTLLKTVGNNWATRVFFSDNGSTAVEVALKMALQSACKRYFNDQDDEFQKIKILGLYGSYHGDTIGAMDACYPNPFNKLVTWYEPRGKWFQPPRILLKNNVYNLQIPFSNQTIQYPSLSSIFSPERSISDPVSLIYKNHIKETITNYIIEGNKFGALLFEPIVMGAGGMIFVDPLFQKLLVEFVREWDGWIKYWGDNRNYEKNDNDWKGLPIIFDEVFTGFWRLGQLSGANALGVKPDIATYAKLLTGGLIPLAVTLTSTSIFSTFLGKSKVDSLLHGHSYTAHPIGCMVANTSLEEYENLIKVSNDWKIGRENWNVNKENQFWSYSSEISSTIINQLSNNSDDISILARPLGNVIYLMTSMISNIESIRKMEEKILNCLNKNL